jgi:hypothetical protein
VANILNTAANYFFFCPAIFRKNILGRLRMAESKRFPGAGSPIRLGRHGFFMFFSETHSGHANFPDFSIFATKITDAVQATVCNFPLPHLHPRSVFFILIHPNFGAYVFQ